MGRIRTVKPELFQHGDLYDVEVDTGLPIRVAFIALFTCCDRDGRFRWKPRELKVACLPYDDCDFSRVLDALTTRGFIVRYASPDGQEYGCIPSWDRHQVINNREGASTYPSPTGTGIVTRAPRVDDACPTPAKGKGREGKGTGREEERNGKELAVSVHTPKVEDIRFEELWAAYGRLGSKPEALRYWSALPEQDKQAIESKAPAYIASTPGGTYRKHLQGWINPKNRLWESAIIERTTPASNGKQTDEEARAERRRIIAERYAGQ